MQRNLPGKSGKTGQALPLQRYPNCINSPTGCSEKRKW